MKRRVGIFLQQSPVFTVRSRNRPLTGDSRFEMDKLDGMSSPEKVASLKGVLDMVDLRRLSFRPNDRNDIEPDRDIPHLA